MQLPHVLRSSPGSLFITHHSVWNRDHCSLAPDVLHEPPVQTFNTATFDTHNVLSSRRVDKPSPTFRTEIAIEHISRVRISTVAAQWWIRYGKGESWEFGRGAKS